MIVSTELYCFTTALFLCRVHPIGTEKLTCETQVDAPVERLIFININIVVYM